MKTTKYIVAAFSLILGLSSCYDLDVAFPTIKWLKATIGKPRLMPSRE